jgi:hypothetical protein
MTHITNKNTVHSALSQDGVENIECFLHWFFEEVDHENLSGRLMDILATYIEHCPVNAKPIHTPVCVTRFFKGLIQATEQLTEIMNKERVWEWIETKDSWALPSKS